MREAHEKWKHDADAYIEELKQQLATAHQRINDLEAREVDVVLLQQQLNEALGALGYPVPGDTPTPRYKCGLCEAKDQQLATAQAAYHELIMAVEKKYPGETRHQTALKYIQRAEREPRGDEQQAQQAREPT